MGEYQVLDHFLSHHYHQCPKAAWGRQKGQSSDSLIPVMSPHSLIFLVSEYCFICVLSHVDVEANTGPWSWRLEMHSVEGKGSTSMMVWIGSVLVIAISVASVVQCHSFLRCI